MKTNNFSRLALSSFILLSTATIDSFAHTKEHNNNPVVKKKTIPGIAVTGDNNLFQHAIWDLGPVFKTAYFNWTFAHNPTGSEPLLLTANMPDDTVLANGLDPLASALGLGPDPALVDASMVNTPLHQVTVTTDPNGFGRGYGTGHRATLPTTLEAGTGAAATRALPNQPITKGEWYKAKGKVVLKCFADGTGKADISLSHLIPHGVYSLWTIHGVMINGKPNMAPYPFGGVPNVLVPDEDGIASASRKLGYCPLTEQELVFIDVAFHSDGNIYGAVPDAPFDSFSQPMGGVTHVHIEFPVHVAGPAPK